MLIGRLLVKLTPVDFNQVIIYLMFD